MFSTTAWLLRSAVAALVGNIFGNWLQYFLSFWVITIIIIMHITIHLGTIIGQEYGLARKATAIGVRVLGDGGSGTYELVVACFSVVVWIFNLTLNMLACIHWAGESLQALTGQPMTTKTVITKNLLLSKHWVYQNPLPHSMLCLLQSCTCIDSGVLARMGNWRHQLHAVIEVIMIGTRPTS